jgi:hypothetical protein
MPSESAEHDEVHAAARRSVSVGEESADPASSQAKGITASPTRRAYAPPQIRALGSVAALTFGATGSVLDGGPHGLKKRHS